MNQYQQPQTAKIYAFPARKRATSGGHRQMGATPQQAAAQFPSVTFGDSWYHDAAIEAADAADDLPHQQH